MWPCHNITLFFTFSHVVNVEVFVSNLQTRKAENKYRSLSSAPESIRYRLQTRSQKWLPFGISENRIRDLGQLGGRTFVSVEEGLTAFYFDGHSAISDAKAAILFHSSSSPSINRCLTPGTMTIMFDNHHNQNVPTPTYHIQPFSIITNNVQALSFSSLPFSFSSSSIIALRLPTSSSSGPYIDDPRMQWTQISRPEDSLEGANANVNKD